jgi:DNA-directed RNA polymerase
VHDSYWTHACDVDEMSTVLRDTFIELHSQDILGRLRQEFIERYAGHVVPVSKIPPGLRAADANPDAADPLGKPVENVDAVFSELDAEDGPGSLSLFAQAGHVKRVGRAPTTTDAWSLDGLEGEEGDMQKVWKGQTSTRTDSKLIYLADVLPPPPGKGDFDLEKIRDSSYFFVRYIRPHSTRNVR